MDNLDTLIAAAQSVVDGLNAIKNAPVPTPKATSIEEVEVKESDGTTETFVPEAAVDAPAQ